MWKLEDLKEFWYNINFFTSERLYFVEKNELFYFENAKFTQKFFMTNFLVKNVMQKLICQF